MSKEITVRWHHGGRFENGRYVEELGQIYADILDPGLWSEEHIGWYVKGMGYPAHSGVYYKASRGTKFTKLEDKMISKWAKKLKNRSTVDLYIEHVVAEAEVAEVEEDDATSEPARDKHLTLAVIVEENEEEMPEENNVSEEVEVEGGCEVNAEVEVNEELTQNDQSRNLSEEVAVEAEIDVAPEVHAQAGVTKGDMNVEEELANESEMRTKEVNVRGMVKTRGGKSQRNRGKKSAQKADYFVPSWFEIRPPMLTETVKKMIAEVTEENEEEKEPEENVNEEVPAQEHGNQMEADQRNELENAEVEAKNGQKMEAENVESDHGQEMEAENVEVVERNNEMEAPQMNEMESKNGQEKENVQVTEQGNETEADQRNEMGSERGQEMEEEVIVVNVTEHENDDFDWDVLISQVDENEVMMESRRNEVRGGVEAGHVVSGDGVNVNVDGRENEEHYVNVEGDSGVNGEVEFFRVNVTQVECEEDDIEAFGGNRADFEEESVHDPDVEGSEAEVEENVEEFELQEADVDGNDKEFRILKKATRRRKEASRKEAREIDPREIPAGLGDVGADDGYEGWGFDKKGSFKGKFGGDEEHFFSDDSDCSLESDMEEGEEGEDIPNRRNSTRVRYDPRSDLPKFELNMAFESADQFRSAVRKYGARKGVNLRIKPNEKHRIRARCQHDDCKWEVFASIDSSTGDFVVKTYKPVHKCIRYNTNKFVNAKFLAEYYNDRSHSQPSIKLIENRELVKNDL